MTEALVVKLRRRPQGPTQVEDLGVESVPMPEPADGEVLVAARYVTVDPYVRSLLDDPSSYGTPVAIGGVPPGDMVGEVVRSRAPGLPEGATVVGRLGWRSHATARPEALRRAGMHGVPPSLELSLLASSAITAWLGVTEVLRPRPGETVVVSGAAGAVGNIACQLARFAGGRVIGIAGGPRKRAFLEDTLGLAGALDYRSGEDLGAALGRLCPEGVHAYFDNVGGPVSDAVLQHLALGSRIALCGEISQYDAPGNEYRARIAGPLMDKRATMTGFLVSDFAHRYDEARGRLAGLVHAGLLKVTEDVVEGLENLPAAFVGMMRGDNLGKRLVKA